MATEISPLLQNYLEGLTDPKTKAALIKELTGNPAPTLEEIRQAMQRVTAGRPQEIKFEAGLTGTEKEADKQRLLARLEELHKIPARELTFDQFSELRGIHEFLALCFPKVEEKL